MASRKYLKLINFLTKLYDTETPVSPEQKCPLCGGNALLDPLVSRDYTRKDQLKFSVKFTCKDCNTSMCMICEWPIPRWLVPK